MLHRSATGWLTIPSGTTHPLYGVWASGPGDAWAVTDDSVMHWDGLKWSPNSPSTTATAYQSVWGSGAKDVWVSSGYGGTFRWNGTKWSQSQLDQRGPITGRGASDVWSASATELDHFDGMSWLPVTVPFTDITEYLALAASADGDLWALRSIGALLGVTKLALLHGGAWREVSDVPFAGIWARTAADAWAVGAAGVISHWGAQGLEPPSSDPRATRDYLSGLGPNDVWTVGSTGTASHFTPSGVTESSPIPVTHAVLSFQAVADNDLWAVDDTGGLFHGDGKIWTPVDVGTKNMLRSVSASGPNDVWVAGDDVLRHKDAAGWSPIAGAAGSVVSIRAWTPNDVWVAGAARLLGHWNGANWSYPDLKAVPGSQVSFVDVGGSGPNDVWVSGGGAGYYVNQMKNAVEVKPTPQIGATVWSVWRVRGVSPTDLWMLDGSDPTRAVMHWDGQGFSVLDVGVRERFTSLWTAANGDVWIAGGPRVLRLLATPP
jgi:hypothetical protein